MKNAYFITVHHKPKQFEWLMEAIYNKDDYFLVHIDLKSFLLIKKHRRGLYGRVREVLRDKPNVVLMRPRFLNWGGWTLSQVALDAIAIMLKKAEDWQYFINLSGQCYPIKPMSHIRDFLGDAGAKGTNFLETQHFSTLGPDDWHTERRPMLELPVRAIKLPWHRNPPTTFQVDWKGSQWCMLTRGFCEWAVTDDLTRKVKGYLKYTMLSDELLFQTLLMNGPFRETRAEHYGREILWPGPKVMGMEDRETLTNSKALFSRKFDEAKDARILECLADLNGFRPVGRPAAIGTEPVLTVGSL